jgi:hypothetical protein
MVGPSPTSLERASISRSAEDRRRNGSLRRRRERDERHDQASAAPDGGAGAVRGGGGDDRAGARRQGHRRALPRPRRVLLGGHLPHRPPGFGIINLPTSKILSSRFSIFSPFDRGISDAADWRNFQDDRIHSDGAARGRIRPKASPPLHCLHFHHPFR